MASLNDIDSDDAPVEHIRAVTKAAGSSFYWAMRILPPDQRHAMFAIYAFCREVDDIADGEMPADGKLARLETWRREIDQVYEGSPNHLTARALVRPACTYGLERSEFHAVIDGMEMDVNGLTVAPTMDQLELYCRRVAGAVGMLSIRIFGAPDARDFALSLGSALQLTNILRDLREDAASGRLYLPAELLAARGIEPNDPAAVLNHPALPQVCADLAALARERFAEAERAARRAPKGTLRPAIVMMMNYRRILDRLIETGWHDIDTPIQVSTPEKLWIALRYGVLNAS